MELVPITKKQKGIHIMSTRYFLSAVPDGIKTQKVLFKNLPNKVVVIDPKEVDEADADILGRLDKDQKKFKADDGDYIQFESEDESTRYNLYENPKGVTVGYLLVKDGGLIAVEEKKAVSPILFLVIGALAVLAIVLGILIGTGVLGKGGSDAAVSGGSVAASSEITIADGEPFDGTIDNGKDDTESETRFIEFPAFTTVYVQPGTTIDLVNPETNHVYFKYTILENDNVLYESDYIAPGQKFAWDATDYIKGAGDHAVVFSVSTISVDDQQPRNGAEFAVTAVVS